VSGARFLILVLLAVPTGAREPPSDGARPSPGALSRPKRIWLHQSMIAPGRDGIASDGERLFILRADRGEVMAYATATGRELWAGKAVSQPRDVWPISEVVVSEGVVVVRGSDDQLAGFDAVGGKLLWRRKEPCDIETTVGRWAILRCHGGRAASDGRLHLVDTQSGRDTRTIPLDWQAEFGLSERALFTWTKAEGRLRKIPLAAGETAWDVPLDLTFLEKILADADTVICAGREVQAFDAASGRRLWSKRPVGDHRGVAVAPVLKAGQLYLAMAEAIVAFDERRGDERRRYPLPPFLRPQPKDHHGYGLQVWGDRVLLVENPAQVSARYLMATWAASGEAPKVLARPLALGWTPLLIGDVLVALVDYDEFAAAYSLAELEPPLAELSRPEALRAVDVEVAPAPRLRTLALSRIPGDATVPGPPSTPAHAIKLGVCKAAQRQMADLQPGAPAGVFGTAHPILVEAAAPDGRWLSVCQARRDTDGDGAVDVLFGHHGEALGDKMVPYLIVGGGAGHRFDELIGHSPAGRYVALREGDCLELVDTVEGTSTTLADADLRDPQPALGPHRGVSFDGADRRMLYLRATEGGDLVVVRDLKTGRETEIAPGAGLIARAELDPEGESVLVDAAIGEDLPQLATTLARRTCRGPAASYSVFGSDQPPPVIVRRIAPAGGGRVREVPGLIRSFGGDLLIRAPDRSLVLEGPHGGRRTIVPANCNATVSHLDAGRHLVLFACESDADQYGKAPLSVYHDGRTTKLNALEDVEDEDHWTQTTGRYAHVYDALIDLDRPGEPPPASAYAGIRRYEGFIRSDGRELRAARKPANHGRAEVGPLRWLPPKE
jgi:hypothetical protein